VPPGTFGPSGHEEEPPRGLLYPGEEQGRRDRSPVSSWDGYVSAAAGGISDEETARLWPPATIEEAKRRAVTAARRPVEDLADEELHWLLFGDTTGEESAG
jgi:hypothetical protein